jgi:hypothetical protein
MFILPAQMSTEGGGSRTYQARADLVDLGKNMHAWNLEHLLCTYVTVLRIRIHRMHMFLGLPDPDPLVRGMDADPDPAIIMQK